FSVSNNRVEIPDSASLRLQTFTIDAWIFPTFVNFPDLGGEIIGKQLSVGSGDVSLSILGPNSSGAYTFAAKQPGGSPSFPSTTGFSLNQWHHVALTSDGTTVRGYVDGVQQAGSFNLALDGPIIYDTSASAPPWTIGGHAGASPGFANRYQYDNTVIDEVGISQRGLSAAEVQAIYNRGALGR